MKIFNISSLFLLLIIFCTVSYSNEIRIVGVELPGLFDEKESAPYRKLFKSIVDDTGLDIKLDIKPLARAFQEYDAGLYDGIYPATTGIVGISSIESDALNSVKVFLFSAPGTPPILSIEQVRGQVVGRVRGMDYPEVIMNAPVKVQLTGDEEQSIKMLLRGRIKALFGTVPDVYLALDKMGGDVNLSVEKSIYYMNNPDAFVLSDNKENRRIMKRLNQSIQKLSANGKIKEILGFAYVE